MENSRSFDIATQLGRVIGIVLSVVIYGLAIGPLVYHYFQ